ncbi:acyltransferase family protein [Methylovulum psychrotolerans]|uniref:Acyltransferase 3 domain-containing protein n=1 Tax=Methylovulum psychrotolerans TaxID=1704499 RepID=A0A1Z4BWS1_9GAMM|nr:acyltransferase [Methylovulum psychrotolerans]ASF45693.1 hypothetical protein CEK71_06180 [Methylovulum psychrotolerans]
MDNVNTFTIRPQILALTGLRFFAASMVFLFHSGAGFALKIGAPISVVNFLSNGFLGVSLFFVLSGFVLTYTYRDGVSSKKKYLLARFARVYPVYMLALIVSLPLVYANLHFSDYVFVLGMVQSWTPYNSSYGFMWIMQAWTISVELFFYLTFPFLIVFLKKIPTKIGLIFLIVIMFLIINFGLSTISPGSNRPEYPLWINFVILPVLRFPEFCLGAIVCRIYLNNISYLNKFPKKYLDLSIFINLLLIVFILSRYSIQSYSILSVATLLFVVLILLFSLGDSIFSRAISCNVLVLLGGASYAEYILQGPIREWVRLFLPSSVIGQIISPVILIAVSIFVYVFYETPVRRRILNQL